MGKDKVKGGKKEITISHLMMTPKSIATILVGFFAPLLLGQFLRTAVTENVLIGLLIVLANAINLHHKTSVHE